MNDRDQQAQAGSVLRVLARAEPPEGMEERILRRMREAERAGHPVAPTRWPQWFVAAVAVCALVMAAVLPKWHSHPAAARNGAERREAVGSVRANEVQGRLNLQPAPSARMRSRAPRHDEQRVEEASFPAPAAPLTKEEQILLQMSEVRTPAEAVAEQSLLHREPAQVPGERLPSLPRETPGDPLPTMTAEVPGHPLPNFFEAMKTGDQP